MALMAVVSPLISFIFALRTYKNYISQFFLLVFAYFFGYYCGHFHDLDGHYYEFMQYYVGASFIDIISNPLTFAHGHDIYHFFIKYIVSRFTSSSQVFGGVACVCHYFLFLLFFNQFRPYFKNRMNLISGLLLITVCLLVEFWWYSNMRFWAGGFFFAAMYLKYINTGKKIYFIWSLFCPLFHYSLIALDVALLLNLILNIIPKLFRYLLLGFALFIRSLNVDFVPLLLKYIPWAKENLSMGVVNKTTRKSVLNYMQQYRETGNIVYTSRPAIILGIGVLILILFKILRIPRDKNLIPVYYMFLTIFTMANFGYADMFFYNRISLVAYVFLWAYIFMMSVKYQAYFQGRTLTFAIILLPLIMYLFLTPIAQVRQYVLHPELLFGNFFMEWDGNALDIDYHRRLIR